MTAPHLPGLTHVRRLGSGGYADVHAYDQQLPERRVAVKVMREPARTPADAAAFLAEANAMAGLEHPFIVPVFSAGLADDGRPYLVMQLYPQPNLGVRSRQEPLSVEEVLRVGVQVGGALATAHAHGLLHRDIKPVNILTSQYGAPGLTDFGLAGSPTDGDEPELGVSVPWAAPEVLFGTSPASVRSDVYSFAATLWTLLVGRSPFELVGAENTAVRLLRRVRTQPAPPTGRADVPAGLEALLARGLAKDPADRPATIAEVVAGLQATQAELGQPVTDFLVSGPPTAAPAPAAAPPPEPAQPGPAPDDSARLAAVLTDPAPQPAPAPPPAPPQGADARVAALLAEPAPAEPEEAQPAPAPPVLRVDGTPYLAAATAHPAPAPAPTPVPATAEAAPRAPGNRLVWLALVLALALAVGAFVLLTRTPPQPTVTITGTRAGDRVAFRWTWQPQQPGDTFNVRVRDRVLPRAQPTIELAGGGRQCISVQVVDAAGAPRGDFSKEGCAG